MTEVDWSKAPVWATVRLQHVRQKDGYCWAEEYDEKSRACFDDIDSYAFRLMPDCWRVIGTRPTTQPAAWNGEGLPPVGTVCEYSTRTSLAVGSPWSDFSLCEIVAMTKHYRIVRIIGKAYTLDHECSFEDSRIRFRPIRTPEQVAADERSKYCDRIFGVLTSATRAENRSDMAEALYDAGLRFKDDAQ